LIWFAYEQFYNPEYVLLFRAMTILYSAVTLTRCVHSLMMIMYDMQSQINNKNGYIDKIGEADLKD
jgi:hypothetical protein